MNLATSFDLDGFESGSTVHLMAAGVCLLATLASSWLGLRWRQRRPRFERLLRIGWGVFIIVTQLVTTIWWLLPQNFSWRVSLPLHICDIVAVLAAVAMLATTRWVWAVLYFWGIGLSIFAFIMPSLTHGPGHVEFYLFWLTHLQIIGTTAYLVTVMRYRPTTHDWMIAELLITLYTIAIFPLDAAFDLNYGYIGPIDSPARIVGAWPGRVLNMYLMQFVLFGVLLLPWLLTRRRSDVQAAGRSN